jgi:phosphoenolpyruvate carboxykinase (ATP)
MCVPSFMADPAVDGTRQANFAILDFTKKVALIGGTGYTGEMKRNLSVLNFILPVDKNTLPMHCSANVEMTVILQFLIVRNWEKSTIS